MPSVLTVVSSTLQTVAAPARAASLAHLRCHKQHVQGSNAGGNIGTTLVQH
jgi:hypothetical protein